MFSINSLKVLDSKSNWKKRSVFLLTSGTTLLHAAKLLGRVHRFGRVLDVLFAWNAHHKLGDVDHLFADSNVLLADENASVMDRVGKLALDNESLKTAFQELSNGQTEDVIELALRVLKETKTHHAADKGLTFENTTFVSSGQTEEHTRRFTEFGESQLSPPDLLLAAETVGTNETELVDKLFLLERTSGSIESRRFCIIG
jgi:hypothetical protein